MPLDIADKVAAVALFGKPSARFMRAINDPQIVIGPSYVDKTVDRYVDDDLVCDPDGRSFGVHSRYPDVGMADRGATLAARKLQASWAADAAADTPDNPAPAQPPDPRCCLCRHRRNPAGPCRGFDIGQTDRLGPLRQHLRPTGLSRSAP